MILSKIHFTPRMSRKKSAAKSEAVTPRPKAWQRQNPTNVRCHLPPSNDMSADADAVERIAIYASEPVKLADLELDRRQDRLADLVSLRDECSHGVSSFNIDDCLDQVKKQVRSKSLDEDFSVAVRERWQTWSRQSRPLRKDIASAAATDLTETGADGAATEFEIMSGSSEDVTADEEEAQPERPSKRTKHSAGHGNEEDWDKIREARETLLFELDHLIPAAFRFSDRQVKTYAQRLKPRHFSSLEEPFHPAEIRRALNKASTDVANNLNNQKTRRPVVLTISFFAGSLDSGNSNESERVDVPCHEDDSFGHPRDNYINRISGPGPDGLKKTQTIELLSTQSLDTLRQCLFCWSDEQPERQGWSQRLQQEASPQGDIRVDNGTSSRSPLYEQDASPTLAKETGQEPRFAIYTGRRRETDTIMVIEDTLYGRGYSCGSGEHDADYLTLLDRLNSQRSDREHVLDLQHGGDLTKSFHDMESVHVGQTYWLLHQGACVHAFMIDQIRAVRSEEVAAVQGGIATSSKSQQFPRITWLTIPTMLRFASDNADNFSIGHRILHAEGHISYAYVGTGEPTTRGANTTQRLAANPHTARTKRREESLLKWRKGRCSACAARKAQIGILGGDRVALHTLSSPDADSPMPSIDEHLTTLCQPCAALLGVPTTQADDDAPHEIDWDAVNKQESRKNGWTIFPMY